MTATRCRLACRFNIAFIGSILTFDPLTSTDYYSYVSFTHSQSLKLMRLLVINSSSSASILS